MFPGFNQKAVVGNVRIGPRWVLHGGSAPARSAAHRCAAADYAGRRARVDRSGWGG